VVKLLLEQGADVKASDSDRKTPLDAATQNAHAEVVKLLLDQGAGVKASDSDGKTPLDAAAQNGHASCYLSKGRLLKASDSECHMLRWSKRRHPMRQRRTDALK
jgi:ankyrin repeat protein